MDSLDNYNFSGSAGKSYICSPCDLNFFIYLVNVVLPVVTYHTFILLVLLSLSLWRRSDPAIGKKSFVLGDLQFDNL